MTTLVPSQVIPNPFGGVEDLPGKLAAAIGRGILAGIANAGRATWEELLRFLDTSSGVRLDAGWFADSDGRAITGTVGSIALAVMVLCLIVAAIQGAVAGEPSVALRAALVEVPRAAMSMAVLVVVGQMLLSGVDAASGAVLSRSGSNLAGFGESYGLALNVASSGLAAGLFALLFFVGAAFVWIELLVRSSLIYFLVAAAPLVFAARVWPETKGVYRKFCELGLALILSKFFIALALGLGAAALSGPDPFGAGPGSNAGSGLSGLLVGAVLVLVAAFTPFVLLKLISVVETAVIAQGISRGPGHAAEKGLQYSYYTQMMSSRGGGGSGGTGSSGGDPGPEGGGGCGGLQPVTAGAAPTASAAPTGGAGAGAGATGGAGAGAGASAGAGAGAGASGSAAGAGAAGGAAAAGPAAAVVAPVLVAKAGFDAAKKQTTEAADGASDIGSGG